MTLMHKGMPYSPCFELDGRTPFILSPDGRYVAAPRKDGVGIWETSGKSMARLDVEGGFPSAFSPDSSCLATQDGEWCGQIQMWSVPSGRLLGTLDTEVGAPTWPAVWFSPDGRYVVAGEDDRIASIFKAPTGPLVKSSSGDECPPPAVAVAFTSDGRSCAFAGEGSGTIHLWDIARGADERCLATIEHPVSCMAFDPRGRRLAVLAVNGPLQILSTESGRVLFQTKENVDGRTRPHARTTVAWDRAGTRVIAGPFDSTAHAAGHVVSMDSATGLCVRIGSEEGDGRAAALSGDLRFAAIADDHGVRIYRTESRELIGEFRFGESMVVDEIRLSTDGGTMAFAREEGPIIVAKHKGLSDTW